MHSCKGDDKMQILYRGEVVSSWEESLGWRLEGRVTGNRMMTYGYLYFASFVFLQCLPSVNSASL